MRVLRAVLAIALFPALLLAQKEVTYTVIMHPALDSLQLNVPKNGVETGWCVDFYTRARVSRADLDYRADTVIRIFLIHRAPTRSADRAGIDFSCPDSTPTIHSHPADDDGRVACDASKLDHWDLTAHFRPFGIVWCAMPGTVTFKPWPHDASGNTGANPVAGQSCWLWPPDVTRRFSMRCPRSAGPT